jgi:hypothetical protein
MNHTATGRLATLTDENGDLTRAPCPSCRASTSDVTDSRAWHGQVKRRRKCRACAHRWSTLEVPFDITNTRQFHLMEAKLRRLAAEATETADALRGLAELVPTKGEG